MIRKEIFHQTLAVTPANLIQFMLGLGNGWVPPTLVKLQDPAGEFRYTTEECSWFASLQYITKGLGPFISAALIDKIGRNRVLLSTAFICFFMWIVVLSSKSIIELYIVRLAFGLALGMFDAASSVYIGENSSPNLRGVFNGILQIFFLSGTLGGLVLATYMTYENVAIVNAALGLVSLVSTILLTEPVQFLIMKGKDKQAIRTHDYLRDPSKQETKLEFEEIKRYVFEEKSDRTSMVKLFRAPEVYKSLRIILSIMFLMMGTGGATVNTFITKAVPKSDYLSLNEFTILFSLLQVIMCCISSCIMDMFNRRTLMLLTSGLIVVTQFSTAALYYAQTKWDIPYFEWLLFITLTAYACIYGMFMYPLSTAILGELLPQKVKAIGSCLGIVACSITSFATAVIYLPVSEAYGMGANFAIYFLMSTFLFIHVYIDLPETRGMTLVEIQKALKKNSKTVVQRTPESES